MKPNQRLEIPVKICNLNNSDVECSQLKLILFGRNIKDLIVFNKEIKDRIGKEKELKTSISIESGNFCKNYYFDIGLFSSADIELDFNFISFKVKVENEK